MKIESISIGPIDYHCEEVLRLVDHNAKKLDGWIQFNECLIQIDLDLDPQRKFVVLWHEILHAILSQAEIELENDEKVISVLSYGIAQVLRDNSEIMTEIETLNNARPDDSNSVQ